MNSTICRSGYAMMEGEGMSTLERRIHKCYGMARREGRRRVMILLVTAFAFAKVLTPIGGNLSLYNPFSGATRWFA